jgi:3-dehydroquinate synthase
MQTVSIDLSIHSYDIFIGRELLQDPKVWLQLPQANKALIVTNTTVAPLYAKALSVPLEKYYAQVLTIQLKDGEAYKDWQSVYDIFGTLLDQQCDRKTTIFALGGGVIGDIAGFAAACYMRGIPFVQVPTTLLAQVDSSVGGKTGINHPHGKNMIGAFYQPKRVICDLSTLHTLPPRELRAGLAEVIKYGCIMDAGFFNYLERSVPALLALDRQEITYVVQRCCQIKAGIVTQDEKEKGLRAILNFGHTFGHAIEAAMGYGHWLHGEAVAVGMLLESKLSVSLGLLEPKFIGRLEHLLRQIGLPTQPPTLPLNTYKRWLQNDKKNEGDSLRFALIGPPGKAHLHTVDITTVAKILNNQG